MYDLAGLSFHGRLECELPELYKGEAVMSSDSQASAMSG